MFLATLPHKNVWEIGVKETATTVIIYQCTCAVTKHKKYKPVGMLNIEHKE